MADCLFVKSTLLISISNERVCCPGIRKKLSRDLNPTWRTSEMAIRLFEMHPHDTGVRARHDYTLAKNLYLLQYLYIVLKNVY